MSSLFSILYKSIDLRSIYSIIGHKKNGTIQSLSNLIPCCKNDILFARMINYIPFNFQITFNNFYALQMLKAMALSTNRAVLSLYKTMLRESQKFTDLNYRSWALRRVRDGFRANSKLAEQSSVERQIQYAKQNLIVMKRQTTVGQLFNVLT